MIKTLFLISTVLVLCNCASNSQVDSGTGPVQIHSSQGDTGTESVNENSSQADVNPESLNVNAAQADTSSEKAEPAGDMEVVEVEAKRERHCTLERRTGTRIPTRYCRTYEVDKNQREADRIWLQNIKSKPMTSTQNG